MAVTKMFEKESDVCQRNVNWSMQENIAQSTINLILGLPIREAVFY